MPEKDMIALLAAVLLTTVKDLGDAETPTPDIKWAVQVARMIRQEVAK